MAAVVHDAVSTRSKKPKPSSFVGMPVPTARRSSPESRAVRACMAARGWTQGQLAVRVGVTATTLSFLLNGRLRDYSEAFQAQLWRKLWLALSDPEARG
jgi:DNA-binding XRE family transcriptional regulator